LVYLEPIERVVASNVVLLWEELTALLQILYLDFRDDFEGRKAERDDRKWKEGKRMGEVCVCILFRYQSLVK